MHSSTHRITAANTATTTRAPRRMTAFEMAYVCLEPFLPPLHSTVRRKLVTLARTFRTRRFSTSADGSLTTRLACRRA